MVFTAFLNSPSGQSFGLWPWQKKISWPRHIYCRNESTSKPKLVLVMWIRVVNCFSLQNLYKDCIFYFKSFLKWYASLDNLYIIIKTCNILEGIYETWQCQMCYKHWCPLINQVTNLVQVESRKQVLMKAYCWYLLDFCVNCFQLK